MRGAALIILAWNQWTLTRRCLDSLLAQDLDAAEIIVVDNGSEDETPTALDAYASRVRIVRLPLITALRKEEAKLNAIAEKWALFGKVELVFDSRKLNAECASLHDVGFKPSNQTLILSRIQVLMLGPAGVAEHFRDQGLHLSRKLLEAKET